MPATRSMVAEPDAVLFRTRILSRYVRLIVRQITGQLSDLRGDDRAEGEKSD